MVEHSNSLDVMGPGINKAIERKEELDRSGGGIYVRETWSLDRAAFIHVQHPDLTTVHSSRKTFHNSSSHTRRSVMGKIGDCTKETLSGYWPSLQQSFSLDKCKSIWSLFHRWCELGHVLRQ